MTMNFLTSTLEEQKDILSSEQLEIERLRIQNEKIGTSNVDQTACCRSDKRIGTETLLPEDLKYVSG